MVWVVRQERSSEEIGGSSHRTVRGFKFEKNVPVWVLRGETPLHSVGAGEGSREYNDQAGLETRFVGVRCSMK